MHWLLSTLYVLWAGLILGVSFIATPLKFLAPHLSLSVALEVGKATFFVFNKIELFTCLSIIIFTALIRKSCGRWWIPMGLLGILLAQTFWILPILDHRADLIISSGVGSPGQFHHLYIAGDILKIILALIGAYWVGSKYERR